MFYSQFILAKKGPLGTIWIAAHLERKLRKNQVADTDIGVSVDSILFPDVPIALRLSSHLLLGVVRIYSRKVNYLFDDCSEALLRIKQAFRSTAVDLPPEQSKAPYHSITLPETFDLDDFELPDSDIFHGNYVDHHVSSREQITLQDTMDGMAYSTSRFGLDERFGDGDTSGLDLDEELFLDKVGTSGDAGASSDPQGYGQTKTSLKRGGNIRGIPGNSEPMIDGIDEDIDLMDDAQAPRTPGLIEEPNLSNGQETSACDDHFETEHHHSTEANVKKNLENVSGETDIRHGKHADDCFLPDSNSHSVIPMPSENGNYSGDLDIEQLRQEEVRVEHRSADNHAPASEPSYHFACHPELSPLSMSADKVVKPSDISQLQEYMPEETVKRINIGSTYEPVEVNDRSDSGDFNKGTNDPLGSASTFHPILECISRDVSPLPRMQVSDNLEVDSQEKEGRTNSKSSSLDGNGKNIDEELQILRPCDANRDELYSSNTVDPKISYEKATPGSVEVSRGEEVLHASEAISVSQFLGSCNANLDELGSSDPKVNQCIDPKLSNENATPGSVEVSGGEKTLQASEASAVAQGDVGHVVDGSEKVTMEDSMTVPSSDELIHAPVCISVDVDNGIVGQRPLEDVNSSECPDLPAPEKMMSSTYGVDNPSSCLLLESTPEHFSRNDEGDAGSNVILGKKRSYTESTLTEQSLNSVECSGIVRSKRTVESIPDDDDLLSSILVGRRSSILKVNPTPSPWEINSVKRSRSAARTVAVKRKVLIDDSMVLHGDTIRQQLMDTEDIRRVRKKAPCTRPEITMIQKQFLEDEIFMDPIYTGLANEVASLHNQTHDLSRIRISLDEVDCSSLEMATDTRSSPKDDNDKDQGTVTAEGSGAQDVTKELDREGNIELLTVAENFHGENVGAPPMEENKVTENCRVSLHVPMQLKTTADIEQNRELLELPQDVAETEIDGKNDSIADVVNTTALYESLLPTNHISGNHCDTSVDYAQVAPSDDKSTGRVQSANSDVAAEADTTFMSSDLKVDEVSTRMEVTCEVVDECKDANVKDSHNTTAVEVEPCTGKEVLSEETEAEINKGELEYTSNRLVSKGLDEMSPFPLGMDLQMKDVLLGNWEHPCQDVGGNLMNMEEAEISSICDYDDLNYSNAGNETEFLNVDDDDEILEPTDDHIPDEPSRITENSGWSSRTRAVANYLQSLFVKQIGNAKPSLLMDNLLVGKSRKEASRMFFEALVLKTKDYIHVEQAHSFENISVKPRMKLMKSDF